MLEELKLILDTVGNLGPYAIWAVVVFMVYKVVLYLSGVGATVILVKLAITRLHNWATSDRSVVHKYKISDLTMSDSLSINLIDCLKSCRGDNLHYLHGDDIRWIITAIDNQKKADKENK